jgi:acyl dehydratase
MADKSAIGRTGEPFTMPIEWGKVREFARAIKDPNPAYFDPELARREYGGVPIPVTFLMTSAFWQDERSMPAVQFDLGRVLHGEQEFELLKPIYVGDVLTGVTRVADVYEKPGGRGGVMTFTVLETRYTNGKGEQVAVARSVILETGQTVNSA